jgi:hypothetical protein
MRALADRADQLIVMNSPQSHDLTATAVNDSSGPEDEAMAAALKSFGRSKKHFRKEKRSQQASKK